MEPGSENYTADFQDAIELTSERKLRFGQTFFQIEVRNVLYKVVMVTNPYHPSGRIPSPSKLGNMKNLKKIENSKMCSHCYS